MIKEMVCIVCPMGCHLTIDTDTLDVKGNTCPRGAIYAKEELTAPKRVITSTVRVVGGIHNRLPVKTSTSIPKELNFECMKLLNNIEVKAPVKHGDIIIKNVLGTGADIIACRDT